MKNLLIKEIKLASSPLTWCFIAFALMALIPNYPILLSAFFVCFGLFHTFQNSRENNDLLFTVLLPVSKADAVRVKYAFTVLIQSLAFVLSLILTLVRMRFLSDIVPFSNTALMSANQIYLAWILVIYTLFNTVFLGGFFKTGWKLGKNFLLFAVSAFIAVCVAETLHHIPPLTFLNSTDSVADIRLWAITMIALAVWMVVTKLSMNGAIRAFEKLDL